MQNARPVWITGAGGLIGHQLVRFAPSAGVRLSPVAAGWSERETQVNFDAGGTYRAAATGDSRTPGPFDSAPITPLLRSDLDLTDFAAMEKRFKRDQPSLVIHCAALSRSPECQGNPALAQKINVAATAHLCALASDTNFIFLSSELVFDGGKGNYVETDTTNPLSVYGETKAAAEQIVLQNPKHTVVRSSLCGGASPNGHHTFNEEICDTWRAGKTTKLFSDEFRCVIPAPVVARAIWELATLRLPGLFHLGGSERLSRVRIGQLIAARHPELKALIHICSLREYEGAPRAADTSLNCEKLQKLLSFPLPGLSQWLQLNPQESF